MNTIVTCTNGHYICTYKGELIVGNILSVEDFVDYAEGVEPFVAHQRAPEKCPFCTGKVFDLSPFGAVVFIHTHEGWKP